jgi:hypothetical protein
MHLGGKIELHHQTKSVARLGPPDHWYRC